MKKGPIITAVVAVVAIAGVSIFISQRNQLEEIEKIPDTSTDVAESSTEVQVNTIIEDLDRPWDVKLASDGSFYFTQRQSGLYKHDQDTQEVYLPEDLYNAGEGGMLGFDLSPDFDESREIYACFNSKTSDGDPKVVVARLILSEDFNSVEEREDIITDIPSAISGRHSGCRVRFDKNNNDSIWITTGDAADANNPQNPVSLAGKVLRVDREGAGVEGNLEAPFDSRIFSYGHRNIQGIALLEEYDETFGYGFTAEHGPSVDDEINPLVKGNFGWDPGLSYNESVPMTDLEQYPDAIEALWSSGDRTIATCGIEYIEGGIWGGSILQAALKDSYILRFKITEDGSLKMVEEVVSDYGRIRQVYQADNGRIFFTTDNGGDDIIGEISLIQ